MIEVRIIVADSATHKTLAVYSDWLPPDEIELRRRTIKEEWQRNGFDVAVFFSYTMRHQNLAL